MAISTAYVNQILPKDAARVSIPGHVIQVVQATSRSWAAIGVDNTWTSFGFSATITPSSTTSKILLISKISLYADRVTGNDNLGAYGFVRNGTQLGLTMSNFRSYDRGGSGIQLQLPGNITYLDSPSSTSALTYTLYGLRYAGVSTFGINGNESITSFGGASDAASSIVLMEIAQ